MGLDMYVTAKRYLWSFDGSTDADIANNISTLFPEMKDCRVKEVSVEAMYWRKANAIHKWFVDNVQDGVDECQETHIDVSKLYELRDVCKAVLDDKSKAEQLLPSQSGFFFGGTAYDEYYFNDVRDTLDWLETLLFVGKFDEKFKHWEFYYQASW